MVELISSLSSTFQLSKDVLFQELDDESVLLDLRSEQYFGLNTVGTRIWQLLAEPRSVDTIVKQLFTEFDVDKEQLDTDVKELLAKMVDVGLITSHPIAVGSLPIVDC